MRQRMKDAFGAELREDVPLGPYTSSRIGGEADILITADSARRLAEIAEWLWENELVFRVLGGGSNVLVSDQGVREVVILNKARTADFIDDEGIFQVRAESGAGLGTIARRASERGWGGLEWAATIPGTIGGAVVGNAGAHGGSMAGNLVMAEILQQGKSMESWAVERFDYAYRESSLKKNPGAAVVLSATLEMEPSTVEESRVKIQAFVAQREKTQPHGASMGSMFKNPSGDFAGRLLDEAGLKGLRRGNAAISDKHANFFINEGDASARDVWGLIQVARSEVAAKFGVELELEIELFGDWEESDADLARVNAG